MAETTIFGGIADPDTLLAREGSDSPEGLSINAHIHLPPNFSAFTTPAEAVERAAEQGIGVLGANNYYDYTVYRPFAEEARRHGIFPLFGLEIITLIDDLVREGIKINDPGNPGKMYICGKGITRFDPLSETASELLGVIRERDSERIAAVITRLAEVFAAAGLNTGLTELAVKERVAQRHNCPIATVYLQERHVAEAFQEAIFEQVSEAERSELLQKAFGIAPRSAPDNAGGIQNEIRSHLMKAGKPAYVPETFVDQDHAFRLILALGGIPCYPTLADGNTPICAFEEPAESLVTHLKERGFTAAEFIPVRNSPAVLMEYTRAFREAGLIVLAGTEHNTREMIPIEPTCLNGEPIPVEAQAIFEEGACVVAAHQYLTEKGHPGYVDADGKLNSAFSSDKERIAYFYRLGAAVIAEYRQGN